MVPKGDESPDLKQDLGQKSTVCACVHVNMHVLCTGKSLTKNFCLLQMRIYLKGSIFHGKATIAFCILSFHHRQGCLFSSIIFKYIFCICLLTTFPLEDWNKANWNKWTGEQIRLHYIDCVGFLIAARWVNVPELIGNE